MTFQNSSVALKLIKTLSVDPNVKKILRSSSSNENKRIKKVIEYIFNKNYINLDSLQEFMTSMMDSYKAKHSNKSSSKADILYSIAKKKFEEQNFSEALDYINKVSKIDWSH